MERSNIGNPVVLQPVLDTISIRLAYWLLRTTTTTLNP